MTGATYTLTPEAADWLATGEQGISSRAIVNYLLLGRVYGNRASNYPHDPDDFRRCERLLRAVPELRAELGSMRTLSEPWAALVERWEEIAALFEEEIPGVIDEWRYGARAPRTYELMREIIDGARARS